MDKSLGILFFFNDKQVFNCYAETLLLQDVVKALQSRRCSQEKRLIFVSTNAQNFPKKYIVICNRRSIIMLSG